MKRVWMKRSAGWAGELWRESLPIGNGKTSALLCGSVGCEHFWINRYNRWENGDDGELPDVHWTLGQTRSLIAQGRYAEANGVLAGALRDAGYRVQLATPMAPVEIQLRFVSEKPFRHYSRGVNLDTGEAFVRYDQGEAAVERRAFVSRSDDQAVLEIRSSGEMTLKVDKPEDDRLKIALTVDEAGMLADMGDYFLVENARRLTLQARFDEMPGAEPYDALLARHLPVYRDVMGDAELVLDGGDRNNELLLDEAQQEEASPELYEKLWRFGRYLFASGTCAEGYPFPLYGLWNGTADAVWAQHVANENVQMIYWHAPVGGFAPLLKPLIHYFYGKMDVFRESAQKLFGCRGIYVSTYTSPLNGHPAPNVPVIVNYISCAGWLCRHFYDYYRYTGDETLLRSEILPFMLETAAFYEDYLIRDENGKIRILPSVSPENTPANFMPEDFQAHLSHVNPVVWNSTMDFAILKELLTNLLSLGESAALDESRMETWREILADIPDYMVNEEGALKEWMDEKLTDFYQHRHLSHVYPLFPGDEIRRGHALFGACERAVDLRQLGAASGWSMPHQSAIYARLGRGDEALECLDVMAKGCVLPNFFTLHNDWRDMGVTMRIDMFPMQLDALMGAVNAVQEMLMDAAPGRLSLLPALPARFGRGEVKNWRFPGGRVSFRWNREERGVEVEMVAERDLSLTVVLPEWAEAGERCLTLKSGEVFRI